MQTGGGQIWAALLLQSREVDKKLAKLIGLHTGTKDFKTGFYNGTMVQDWPNRPFIDALVLSMPYLCKNCFFTQIQMLG